MTSENGLDGHMFSKEKRHVVGHVDKEDETIFL